MTHIDKTKDFINTVAILSNSKIKKINNSKKNRINLPLYTLSIQLNESLKQINTLLKDLEQKSKKRTMFNDISKEINDIADVIKNCISNSSGYLSVFLHTIEHSGVF